MKTAFQSLDYTHKKNKIKIANTVRQRNRISPKRFTASLESIFCKTDCKEKGINIDGEYLKRFEIRRWQISTIEIPVELQKC